MDKRQCDFFKASFLRGSNPGPSSGSAEDTLPGIPMHHDELYKTEKECEVLCEKLDVTFANWKGTFGVLSSLVICLNQIALCLTLHISPGGTGANKLNLIRSK